MSNGYTQLIRERIAGANEGTIFVNSDFSDIAETETVTEQELTPEEVA